MSKHTPVNREKFDAVGENAEVRVKVPGPTFSIEKCHE
jgi:hypothetical protein